MSVNYALIPLGTAGASWKKATPSPVRLNARDFHRNFCQCLIVNVSPSSSPSMKQEVGSEDGSVGVSVD